MTEHPERLVFSLGDPNVTARCPITGRLFEVGSGALPHEQQTANFVRQRDMKADMPTEGEICLQTGRPFECGSGALSKADQTRIFLSELPREAKEARAAAAASLAAVEPSGRA
jgi:hypothetical protein